MWRDEHAGAPRRVLIVNSADPRRILLMTSLAGLRRRSPADLFPDMWGGRDIMSGALSWAGILHGIGARLLRGYAEADQSENKSLGEDQSQMAPFARRPR